MPITVIVGGQFGSEGKGKVAHALALEMNAVAAVRVGGPNSGHTVIGPSGQRIVFRQLPTACLLPDVVSVVPAGSYINPSLLLEEAQVARLTPGRLVIDEYAMLISKDDSHLERQQELDFRVGSTLSGTGAAVARRVMRVPGVRFARDEPGLAAYVGRANQILFDVLKDKGRVVLEGTQGFGLSLLHSRRYPHTTSRDTTAAGVLSETGLSPRWVDDIVVVLRSFPIRVAGNSGHLPQEIDWETVTLESGSREAVIERTTVTDRVRRVGRFDPEVVGEAIAHNSPTRIALNHVDYVDHAVFDQDSLTPRVEAFVTAIERDIRWRVEYVGTSPRMLVKRATGADARRVA